MRQWPYEPIRDFRSIRKLGSTPRGFAVRRELPARTVVEFVAYARCRALAFGCYPPGSTGHAFAQLLSETERLDMLPVPYRGEAPQFRGPETFAADVARALPQWQALAVQMNLAG